MPWQEESTMQLRRQFIPDVQSGVTAITELCAAYGISRKTGYKWLTRYDAGGLGALADQSRRPHTSPTATPPELVRALLEARHPHPTWGPRKLLQLVRQRWEAPWPARSTIAWHLQRAGLVVTPRRVRRPGHPGRPQAPMDAPNAVWTADFKGQFRLGDASLCYPLTIADGYSRLLLSCRALTSTRVEESRPVFVRAFQGVRPAHPPALGQRRALRDPSARAALGPLGLVGAARHPAGSHRAGLTPAERAARAHASHP